MIVYTHRNNDGEIFYVGMGKYNNRAYSKQGRSVLWEEEAKNGYEVDVVHRCESEEEAIELEMFLIDEIGRRDLNTGTLVNLTDGGRGIKGYKLTEWVRSRSCKNLDAFRDN